MNKGEIINKINDIIKFITEGKVTMFNQTFNGHPSFYLVHSKEKFDQKLDSILKEKTYDEYSLYYYTNYMFKYMLDKYDSHTKAHFINDKYLPIKIRIFNKTPYIVDCENENKKYKGTKILKINDVNIDKIIKELEKIICYPSDNYLKIELEKYLSDVHILNSLPSVNISNKINITTNKGEITYDLNHLNEYEDKEIKPNYNLEIINKTAVITYNSCRDEEKMNNLIKKLSKMNNIENYIIDIRGNGGGNSKVNKPLEKFLKDKKTIVLCDERVFSSARMLLITLKNQGAYTIGTPPATSINCFGNCAMQKELKQMNLKIMGSATYWYYDENLKLHGYYKNEFEKALKENPNIIKPFFVDVDKKIGITLEDYINNNDSVLNYALKLINRW